MKAVRIDFDNIYDFDEISSDLKVGIFRTELADGREVLLRVEIDSEPHKLLPDVYNLALDR